MPIVPLPLQSVLYLQTEMNKEAVGEETYYSCTNGKKVVWQLLRIGLPYTGVTPPKKRGKLQRCLMHILPPVPKKTCTKKALQNRTLKI
jgi:hypothetical protein